MEGADLQHVDKFNFNKMKRRNNQSSKVHILAFLELSTTSSNRDAAV